MSIPDIKLKKIDDFMRKGEGILNIKWNPQRDDEIPSIPFFTWANEILQFFDDNFDKSFNYRLLFVNKVLVHAQQAYPHKYHVNFGINILQSLISYLVENPNLSESKQTDDASKRLARIYHNFHNIAVQLEKRKHNRPPFIIDNEYDVQDLMQICLMVTFDDIRREEWTPSYCGSSKRVDFLLKEEKIVIETKITSEKHSTKEIGDELLVDIAHYKEISDCKILSCVIYDPKYLIENAPGFMKDIEKNSTINFEVSLDILPFR
jgi:hypothetical protein